MAPLTRLFAILVGLSLLAPNLVAQEGEPASLRVAPGEATVVLRLGDLLEGGALRDALESGLPIRILVRVQLWKDRLFDSQEGQAEWRASVFFDPLDETYRVQASRDPVIDLTLETLDEARRALQRNFRVSLRPRTPGRYYYLARVEVETLALSDLEELQRWLRGDLAPAVEGGREVEGAMAQGVRRLLVRVLGLPTRRFQLRTPTFAYPPGDG